MDPYCYGRSGKGGLRAIVDIYKWTEVEFLVQIDIKKCFPCVPHNLLLRSLRKHIEDKAFVDLIATWLSSSIMDKERTYVKHGSIGLAQGSPLSPVECLFKYI